MADTDIYVPDEIVNNILFRLPTKSLTRFRCVAKQWNRLISDPDLMKSLSRRKIFIPGQPSCQMIEKIKRITVGGITVGGTTNGVLKKVPKQPFINIIIVAFGLGHGATQDDVKIVTLLGPNRSNKTSSSFLSWRVFSVKNQSWSTMSESSIGYFEFSDRSGTFLNGFLYWKFHKDPYMTILALDMKEKKLVEMEVPYDDCRMRYATMGTINGCLCLLIYYKGLELDEYELLVMKDHGIWESRFKGCWPSTVLSRMKSEAFLVMCYLDEGKFIMKNLGDNTFLIVDLVKDSFKRIIFYTDPNQFSPKEAIEYVESFCSI
uniref:uncharacterized protein LOC122588088 n=1 Tax=Erigeron canadensis TaxID=72917 RepID=UPI001CB9AD9C|nr:uncharacterized protein LOC122588088 [Erigeron canadensis]